MVWPWLMRLKLQVGRYHLCATVKSHVKSCNILLYCLNEVCVCVWGGDNPAESPSETPLSHLICFDPVLGGSLISHNAADQWFPLSADVICGFKPRLLCCAAIWLCLRGGGWVGSGLLLRSLKERSISAHTEGYINIWTHTGKCVHVYMYVYVCSIHPKPIH